MTERDTIFFNKEESLMYQEMQVKLKELDDRLVQIARYL